MLAIHRSKDLGGKCIPNILPCRVNHCGPANASKRYWSTTEGDDKRISYFRGRKLHGKSIKVPDGYRGSVLSTTNLTLPQDSQAPQDSEVEGEEPILKAGIIEEKANFEELVVWGHESLPCDTEDLYVTGVEEWIMFSKQVHSYSSCGSSKSISQKS